jgi:hypothetical protein
VPTRRGGDNRPSGLRGCGSLVRHPVPEGSPSTAPSTRGTPGACAGRSELRKSSSGNEWPEGESNPRHGDFPFAPVRTHTHVRKVRWYSHLHFRTRRTRSCPCAHVATRGATRAASSRCDRAHPANCRTRDAGFSQAQNSARRRGGRARPAGRGRTSRSPHPALRAELRGVRDLAPARVAGARARHRRATLGTELRAPHRFAGDRRTATWAPRRTSEGNGGEAGSGRQHSRRAPRDRQRATIRQPFATVRCLSVPRPSARCAGPPRPSRPDPLCPDPSHRGATARRAQRGPIACTLTNSTG